MLKRKILLSIIDIIFFIVSAFLYFFSKGEITFVNFYDLIDVVLLSAVAVIVRMSIGAYKNLLRYAGTKDYLMLVIADVITFCIVHILAIVSGRKDFNVNEQLFIIMGGMLLALSSRFVYKIFRYTLLKKLFNKDYKEPMIEAKKKNVIIVGAGHFGASLAKEIVNERKNEYNILYFVDADKAKAGSYVQGIKVYNEDQSTMKLIDKSDVDEIIIALPGIPEARRKEIYNMYLEKCSKVQLYDYVFNSIEDGNETGMHMREIKIEDLLFRNQQTLNREVINNMYSGKTILITGGGGSIGSEICRQLAKARPKKLIILDIYENNAYDIRQELTNDYGDALDIEIEIVSITDINAVNTVFEHYRPEVVFHAAAHKHVPLMEHNPREAVLNNVFGTYNIANAAEAYGVGKFIMISTDKAVNPTNIMGATKRMCEMIVLSRINSDTEFAAVRFGNVLGSNGSVIPLFKRQIEAGGPVTITDKRIIRYFMTIPEASQLVMYAGAIAKRSELFVLDMGNPVKILDLALNLIRLSGYVPYKDIDIVEVGLRPGEKLYEELLVNSKNLKTTENEQIFIEKEIQPTREDVEEKLEILRNALCETEGMFDSEAVMKSAMRKVVPTYKTPEEVNEDAEQAIAEEMCV